MADLYHYGTPRHSGRYPWGSGKNPQRNKNFHSRVKELEKKGMTEAEIAKGFGMSTTQLRARMTIATNELKKENIDRANRLKEHGYSNVKIAEMMNTTESNIRNWLKPGAREKRDSIQQLADVLKEQVDKKGYIDVGKGVELSLNTTHTKLEVAMEILKDQGYVTTNVQVDQAGTKKGQKTLVKVLAPPGTTYKDVNSQKDKIRTIEEYDTNTDISRLGLPPVKSISSDRIKINYAETGGTDKDGVIELRRGLTDLNLGNANYAQVRIGVDGTHYLKGMAMYSDNMPPGVDVIFNTNKSNKKPKMEVLKKMKTDENGVVDKDNPFGATIKPEEDLKRVPRYYIDENGKKQVSPINVVNEEGNWAKWTPSISAQVLSKQPIPLVNRQLSLTYDMRKSELDEIKALDNPIVKKKLLESYANDCDASAVHLKAAALPRQTASVILPLPDIKENEIFAPKYSTGTQVALVRFPHGGTFEIPILTVNNNNKDGKSLIGTDSPDAVGIHPRAAERLSGADFDGDTVLVIPTGGDIKIKSTKQLKGLEGFDPKKEYAIDRSDPIQNKIPEMKEETKQKQMGVVTNLITDMTIKGASPDEIAMATRHSMVVIDAVKHDLDYRKSEKDNHIKELKEKYQIQADGSTGGASTLISRAKSEKRIPTRKEVGWDPETGEKMYEDKPEDTFPVRSKKTNEVIRIERRTETTTQMAYATDAKDLISPFNSAVERAYADYANNLKNLANEARKEYMATENPKRDPDAAKAYEKEVASLKNKLNVAKKNSPRERQAQLIADQTIAMKRANGEIPDDKKEIKKFRAQALASARVRVGANKKKVEFTPREWEAVQARAISSSMLSEILNNADLDQVRKLSTPRTQKVMSNAKVSLAKSMLKRGYTLEEVAAYCGVSPSTISNAVS